MSLFHTFIDSLSWITPFLAVLTILVFLHELGHYSFARWFGVKIEVFSIGFGPEIFGWNDKSGTRWKFSLIPLGGYVKMFGDENAASAPDKKALGAMSEDDRKKTLDGKPIWQRILVVLAGPVANILVTILLLWVAYLFVGETSRQPVVGSVMENSPAYQVGLTPDDKIIEIDGKKIPSFMVAKNIINANPEKELSMKIARDGDVRSLLITPEKRVLDGITEIGITGIVPKNIPHTLFSGVAAAFKTTYVLSLEFFKMLGRLVVGGEDASKLGGLGMIAKMSHDSWIGGIFALMGFMALLSLNLGLINLVPVPMLDGGHILMYIIEAIRGKPLSEKTMDISFKIGLGIVLCLMIYGNWNDIKRYKIIEMILSIFS